MDAGSGFVSVAAGLDSTLLSVFGSTLAAAAGFGFAVAGIDGDDVPFFPNMAR